MKTLITVFGTRPNSDTNTVIIADYFPIVNLFAKERCIISIKSIPIHIIAEMLDRHIEYQSSIYFHYTNDFKEFEDFIDWYVLYRIKAVGLIWNKKGGAWQGRGL